MIRANFFILLLVHGVCNTLYAVSPERYVISSGWSSHTCALDDNGVTCWGRLIGNELQTSHDYGPTDVPTLSNPTQISSGGDGNSCALDDNGVTCWGYNNYGQTSVPTLSNPTQISLGGGHTCALDDNGVTCWGGSNVRGQNDVPTLSNPTQVSLGIDHTCALDDNGVTCWGFNGYGQTNVPTLSNPTQVSLGVRHTCALDDNGVTCWGNNEYGQTDVPTLSNPTQVSSGGFHTCALDDNGVTCWGRNDFGQTDVPTLSNLTQLSVGGYHNCALDDNGVTCWGYNYFGQTSVPTLSFTYIPVLSDQTVSYIRGEEITSERLSNTGGYEISGCEVTSGTLPTGLILSVTSDNTTCEITGTPSVVTAPNTISITATNSYGSDSADITLEITAQPIPNLSDPSEHQALNLNQLITPIEFSNSGGLVTACTIFAGTLPAGLSLDVIQVGDYSTCEITGTPTEVVSSTNIAIQATNESGSDYAYLSIEVVATSTPPTHQVPHPLWLYGILLAGLGILGVRGISQSRA